MAQERPGGPPPSEGNRPKEATREQKSTAQVLSFLTLEVIAQKRAMKYHEWKETRLPVPYREPFDYLRISRTTNALVELYVLKTNNLPLEKFQAKHKGRIEDYETMLSEMTPEIDAANARIEARTPDITDAERRSITIQALKKIAGNSHRKNLVTMEGLTEEDRKRKRKRLIISGGLSAGTGILGGLTAATAAAIAAGHEIADPTFDSGSIVKTALIVAGSYALHYAMIYADYRSIYKLLDHPDIKTSPSILATAAYYTTTQLLPEDEALTRKAVWTGTAAPALWQEPGFIGGLLLTALFPAVGPAVVVGRNLGGAAFNLAETLANHAYRKLIDVKTRRNRRNGTPAEESSTEELSTEELSEEEEN